MDLFPLVEGQTLLHDGRYRFLRRIGRGTFAFILRAMDMQTEQLVAIKCIQEPEYNTIGVREAKILRMLNGCDQSTSCPVVRLLHTFQEHGHYCLVLELLGSSILNVAQWGAWRQAQLDVRRHPFLIPSPNQHKLHYHAIRKRQIPAGSLAISQQDAAKCVRLSSLPLDEIRQIAVHLCSALAFVHDQTLIHSDLKPENICRTSIAGSSSSSSMAIVKLVDFGNCVETEQIPLYEAQNDLDGAGFDLQTLTYRAPEVAAGLVISPAMDMWSLGCILVECATGEPFIAPLSRPIDSSVNFVENAQLLQQIEILVNDGKPLDSTYPNYRQSRCYTKRPNIKKTTSKPSFTSLRERLEAAVPISTESHRQFHDFIGELLDTNPGTRLSARDALFHPFLQAFFPFRMMFASKSTVKPVSRAAVKYEMSGGVLLSPLQYQPRIHDEETISLQSNSKKKKRVSNAIPSTTSVKKLRDALKLIPSAMKD